MNIINEIKEDIECLKYVFKHKTLNGSVIRLARMIRMGYFITFILIIIIILWKFD